MKVLTSKNKLKFDNRQELNEYIKEHNLIVLAQVDNYGSYSYITPHTHVNGTRAYDIYVINLYYNTLIKHHKLKVYYQNNGGFYVKSSGRKCWVNSFFDPKHDYILVPTDKVIEQLTNKNN